MKKVLIGLLVLMSTYASASEFEISVTNLMSKENSFICYTKSDLTMDEEIRGIGALVDKKIGDDLNITANQSESTLYLTVYNQGMSIRTAVLGNFQQNYVTTTSNISLEITRVDNASSGDMSICGK